jgi:hypothetical protein
MPRCAVSIASATPGPCATGAAVGDRRVPVDRACSHGSTRRAGRRRRARPSRRCG